VNFRCPEYAAGMVIASDEIRARIVEIGIRKVARAAGVDSKTVMLIIRGVPVKRSTLAPVLQFVNAQRIHLPAADAGRLRAGGSAGRVASA